MWFFRKVIHPKREGCILRGKTLAMVNLFLFGGISNERNARGLQKIKIKSEETEKGAGMNRCVAVQLIIENET